MRRERRQVLMRVLEYVLLVRIITKLLLEERKGEAVRRMNREKGIKF